MFAYCLNNPVIYVDSTGNDCYPAIVKTMIRDDDGGYGYPIISEIADTPAEQVSGVINGQGNLPYSNKRIGFGSYGHSGCSYIAVYNAMQLIGRPESLGAITNEFLMIHGTVCFGAGGAGPWSIQSYFSAHGVETKGAFASAPLTQDISEGDVIVFTVWNNRKISGGWHTMTALYTNGKYLVFNRYNTSTTHVEYSSLEEVYSEGIWIYGMRIE